MFRDGYGTSRALCAFLTRPASRMSVEQLRGDTPAGGGGLLVICRYLKAAVITHDAVAARALRQRA